MRKHGHGPGHPLRLAANAGTAMPQDAKAEPMMPTKAKMICVGPAGSIGVEWKMRGREASILSIQSPGMPMPNEDDVHQRVQ